MDPSRTLVTFLLETDPSIASVQLVGSWDNFSACYAMQRDTRRGRGHWRGCHTFNPADDDQDHDQSQDAARRYKTDAGLSMGHTYYYYYQVNGSADAYDPIRPTTTACPYLPGQVVNTLYIPVERSLRQRSASLSSLDQDCFRTMDPQSKFQTPKPVLPLAAAADDDDTRYIGTAAPACAPFVVREPTPKSSWRRFFARKMASRDLANGQDDDAPRPVTQGERSIATASSNYDGGRSTAVSDGPRSRDMSPNSLRRFLLSEDLSPTSTTSTFDDLPQLLPYDITEIDDQDLGEEDEDDDDDNFAAPAAAFEQTIYTTRLSPPPFKRTTSSDSQPPAGLNSSALTLIPQRQPTAIKPTTALHDASSATTTVPKLKTTSLSLTPSEPSSAATSSPVSPQSLSAEFPSSFYDDSDALSANEEEDSATQDLSSPVSVFRGYSLPRADDDEGYYGKQANYHVSGAAAASPRFATVNSPQLLPRGGGGVAAAAAATGQAGNGVDFLGGSLDVGLDDFAAEMGWLADSITRHA
ncbi:hypothetical protein K4F52_006271 [Lecanicillium sp. MT-2017a]|nr:hypothetical protein K4F52_006271 [Lecanicillium sp. MT-2017a]